VVHGAAASLPLRASEARDRLADEVVRLYDDGRYVQVVARCGKGAIGGEAAGFCFLAACHVGDEAAARRHVAAIPMERRDRLVTNCKQLGVDLQREACEADPMACQH
jgi:hypothetical protein